MPYGERKSDCGVGFMIILKVRCKLQKNGSIQRILGGYYDLINQSHINNGGSVYVYISMIFTRFRGEIDGFEN